ncbi:MAG: hypothetical protein ACI8RD_013493, partial [Bacillariaceae sp.]
MNKARDDDILLSLRVRIEIFESCSDTIQFCRKKKEQFCVRW